MLCRLFDRSTRQRCKGVGGNTRRRLLCYNMRGQAKSGRSMAEGGEREKESWSDVENDCQ